MEKTVDHCNIFVDKLDCKLVLVFHCKHDEERMRVREREKNKEEDKDREKERESLRERKRNPGKEIMIDDILEKKLLCIC